MSRANLEIAVVKRTGTGAVATVDELANTPAKFALFRGSGSTEAAFATDKMRGKTAYLGAPSAALSNQITEVTDNGVVLGTSDRVNAAATDYYGVIIGSRGDGAATGVYRGTGVAGNVQSGHFPFAPDIVIAHCSTHTIGSGVMRTASMQTAYSTLLSASNSLNILITGLLSDGISVGTSTSVNGASYTYDYLALPSVSGAIEHGKYTGTGAAQDIAASMDMSEGVFLLIKASSQTTPTSALMATSEMVNTDAISGFKVTAVAAETDAVLAMTSSGFSLGASAVVNESGKTYYWMALKAGAYNVTPSRAAA